jgi:hypothetical protein
MERLFLAGPRALFGRKTDTVRPVEELLANLSDAPKSPPKRKRAPRKPRAKSAAGASTFD